MTQDKQRKRAVRERMERTGENYTTAARNLAVERCELSELPVKQCACRIHGPAESPADSDSGSHTFNARYAGQCRECGEQIDVGDLICAALGGYVHEECA